MQQLRWFLFSLLVPIGAHALELTDGIELKGSYINDALAKVAGSGRRGGVDEGLLSAGLQFDLCKLVKWDGAVFFASAYYIHGASLTQKYVHDLNYVSSIDAYDTVRLNEVWLEQKLFEERFSIKAGLLVSDTDFADCETGDMFVNSVFGQPAVYGVNANGPTYPLSSPAVRLQWRITPQWSVKAGAYSGAVGQQDRSNRHGARFRFDSQPGGFYFGEVEHDYGEALPASIKVGGYYNNGLQDDFSNAGKRERGLEAVYGIFEQTLYRPNRPTGKDASKDASKDRCKSDDEDKKEPGLRLFLEVGDAGPEDRTLVAWETEVGIVAQGLLFGREHDRLGLAFGLTHLGKDVAFVDGERVTAHHESMIEATYQVEVREHLSLQPDVQVVFNPGAATRAATAVVVGLRATLSF